MEDIVTGLWIQSQGWKSVYYNPSIRAFSGIAPTNLLHTLVQLRRWAEGHLQILFSEFRPKCYGHNKINLGLQLGYFHYHSFAITSLSVLYYSIIPPLYLLKGISFFPKVCPFLKKITTLQHFFLSNSISNTISHSKLLKIYGSTVNVANILCLIYCFNRCVAYGLYLSHV